MVGCSERVGRIAKVFAFGIELTPEIASSKKLHTWGRLASLAPGTLFLAKEDMWMCQRFLTFLGPNSDCQGYSGHFLGLFWGCAEAAKVNLLTFFWGFASSISSRLIRKYLAGLRRGRKFAQTTSTIRKLPTALVAPDRWCQSFLIKTLTLS